MTVSRFALLILPVLMFACADEQGDPGRVLYLSPPPRTGTDVEPTLPAAADNALGGIEQGATPGGPTEPVAGDALDTFAWPVQTARFGSTWGPALVDIAQHLPARYGTQYDDADSIAFGHETTHGINAHLRTALNTTGKRASGFYLMQDRAAIVVEPNIRKGYVAAFVPPALRASRFSKYITGQSVWDDTPLYICDEWIAYTNGSEVGIDRVQRGLWTTGWRDGVMGTLELTVYALALGMAVEKYDPTYFANYKQFRELLGWNTRRAMALFRTGSALSEFKYERQDVLVKTLRTDRSAAPIREFARRTFGVIWATNVLGIADHE